MFTDQDLHDFVFGIPVLARAHSWIALSALVIGFIVRLMKSDVVPGLFSWISPKYRVLVALLLGQIAGILESVSQGVKIHDAMIRGFVSSAVAVLGHDLLIEGVRGGKELFDLSGKRKSRTG